MSSRYFPSGLYLWKNIIVVSLFLPSSTGIPNFYPVNSCTDIKLKDIPEDVFQRCSTTNSAIHCLPDENNNLGLSCFQVTWISKDKCPSYNSYQGNMDEKDCSTDHKGTCPGDLYKSPLSVLYTGCYIKELLPPPTTTPSMTTKTMTTKTPTTSKNFSSDPMANASIIPGITNQKVQISIDYSKNGVGEAGKGWKIAFFIILALAFLLIAAGCVSCVIFKRKVCDKCKQAIRKAICHNQEAQNADFRPHGSHNVSDVLMVEKSDSKFNGLLH